MQGLTNFVLSLCNLMEAEGRLLQENVLRAFTRCLLLLAGIGFTLTAACLFLSAIYKALLLIISPIWATLILGVLFLLLAVIFIWSALKWGKNH